MRLVRLYSNDERRFPTISFVDGLNVVFARVQEATLRRDSHNLGKTLLISVIDFALLGTPRDEHPFKKHVDRFRDFTFSIELLTPTGRRITIRRSVEGKRSIAIHVCDGGDSDLPETEGEWTYHDLGLKKAKELLDKELELTPLRAQGFDFRDGLRYLMRRQADYGDPFRLSVFLGPDRDWKPFIAMLLGFDPSLIRSKYDARNAEDELERRYREAEAASGARGSEYDELRATIEIKEADVARLTADLDSFKFASFDTDLQKQLVEKSDAKISELNNELYRIGFDLGEIERSLSTSIPFDLDEVKRIFDETHTYFPEPLLRSYEQLVAFNRRISSGRSSRLKELHESLAAKKVALQSELEEEDGKRAEMLRTLSGKPALEKFRQLQRQLIAAERELGDLRSRLKTLDQAGEIKRQLQEARRKQEDLGQLINEQVLALPPKMREVRRVFADHAKRIMNLDAFVAASVNSEQNIEFKVRTLDRDKGQRETSAGHGTSYAKMLCVCFDLALLETYCREPFYRFAYHDGVFEGLDNRRKVNLLADVREFVGRTGAQYILTVIDSDLPRDERDGKLLFDQGEVVRELHDGGDDGRLFRMPAF